MNNNKYKSVAEKIKDQKKPKRLKKYSDKKRKIKKIIVGIVSLILIGTILFFGYRFINKKLEENKKFKEQKEKFIVKKDKDINFVYLKNSNEDIEVIKEKPKGINVNSNFNYKMDFYREYTVYNNGRSFTSSISKYEKHSSTLLKEFISKRKKELSKDENIFDDINNFTRKKSGIEITGFVYNVSTTYVDAINYEFIASKNKKIYHSIYVTNDYEQAISMFEVFLNNN